MNDSVPARLLRRAADLDVQSLAREIRTRQLDVVFLLIVLLFAGALSVSAQQSELLQPYLVRVAVPNTLVAAGDTTDELIPDVTPQEEEFVRALLDELADTGQADTITFDEAERAYHVELSDEAREELSRHPAVVSIEPVPDVTPADNAHKNHAVVGH